MESFSYVKLFFGILLALFVAGAAYRAHSLDKSGALAAVLEGTLIFGFGGWRWAILLLAFFVSSSGLSHAFKGRKRSLGEKFSKGSRRDAGQVLSNGGLAALFAALHPFFPDAVWVWVGFAAALAAVNADTWGTELGVLNPSAPRLITRLRQRVEKGTSGGVSLAGSVASFAGAALLGILAGFFSPTGAGVNLALLVTLAGFAASLFDSFLGATVQAIYRCPVCEKETERHPYHTCGAKTVQIRGWAWLNNDWVNFACAVFGAALAIILL
jgi:uncharacterized protein (TIGR00297 family)